MTAQDECTPIQSAPVGTRETRCSRTAVDPFRRRENSNPVGRNRGRSQGHCGAGHRGTRPDGVRAARSWAAPSASRPVPGQATPGPVPSRTATWNTGRSVRHQPAGAAIRRRIETLPARTLAGPAPGTRRRNGHGNEARVDAMIDRCSPGLELLPYLPAPGTPARAGTNSSITADFRSCGGRSPWASTKSWNAC